MSFISYLNVFKYYVNIRMGYRNIQTYQTLKMAEMDQRMGLFSQNQKALALSHSIYSLPTYNDLHCQPVHHCI